MHSLSKFLDPPVTNRALQYVFPRMPSCDRFLHTIFFAFVGSTRCPSGWPPSLLSAHDTNGNCYIRMPTAKNFTAAEDNCRVQGGHLASIASDNENDIVRNLNNTQIWIGLNDRDEEDTFVWTDSSSYNYTMWVEPNEPNNEGNGKEGPANCVRMTSSGKWRDTLCSDNLAYVCEISAQTATTQAPMTAGKMSHSYKPQLHSRSTVYVFHAPISTVDKWWDSLFFPRNRSVLYFCREL